MGRILLRSTGVLVAILIATAANGASRTWQLNDVIFDDGGSATGTFRYDDATQTFSNVNVTTALGTAFAGDSYLSLEGYALSPNPSDTFIAFAFITDNYPVQTNETALALFTTGDFATANTIAVDAYVGGEFTCISEGECSSENILIRTLTGGTLNAVPLPAALWLLGSALGLLSWMRRKASKSRALDEYQEPAAGRGMIKTRISSHLVAGLAACLLLVAGQSQAALVTHVFTGDVTDPGECGAQCVGQQFTAIFQYDTETLPLLDTPLVRQWSLADFTFEVSVGPVSDLSGGEGTLHLSNSGGGSGDVFSASGSNAGFLLIDTDATAFSSVDLPLALNISDFEIAEFFISWPLDSAANIQGQITQIETVVGAVPLPGAFLLLGSALSLLGWLKRAT